MVSAMGKPQATTTTPESRLRDLQHAAANFSTHLKTSPGTILPPHVRLGVAICARDALLRCKCCALATTGVCCLRPGSSFYDFLLQQKEHEPFPTNCNRDDEAQQSMSDDTKACLVNIIHTVVCHQSKINDMWYKDSIGALQSCGILADHVKQSKNCVDCDGDTTNELELGSQAVFVEIILLAVTSHGIHSTFLALEVDIPALPTWEEMKGAPEPMHICYSSLLHRVRRDESKAFAPYFLAKDIRKNSPECKKIEKEVWNEFKFICGLGPYICGTFAPNDIVMFQTRFMSSFYLTIGEMLLNWGELDSTRHCSHVTRHDMETVANAVAVAHSCDF